MSTQAIESPTGAGHSQSSAVSPQSDLDNRTASQATKIFTCPICQQTFRNESNLENHGWCTPAVDADAALEKAKDAARLAIPLPPPAITLLPSPAVGVLGKGNQ